MCWGQQYQRLSGYTHPLSQDGVKLFQQAVDSNLTLDTVYPVVHELCLEALPRGGEYTCPGFIYSYGPVVSLWAVLSSYSCDTL